ncbi:hypothetical protein [Streptosporangium canum]|uniref:hypothetical protein n=1 Tax=Streptosporangium canum TaxID=324952 RepID=UPI0037AA77D9
MSLTAGEPSRKGIVDRHEDDADHRRTIVSIAEANRASADAWLARGAQAWRTALEPLTHEQRETFVETLRTYEREAAAEHGDA